MTWTHQAVELHLGRPVTVARWRVHQGRHHGFYEVKAAAHADLFKFARIITNRFDTAFEIYAVDWGLMSSGSMRY
jgi:hypothetical protein